MRPFPGILTLDYETSLKNSTPLPRTAAFIKIHAHHPHTIAFVVMHFNPSTLPPLEDPSVEDAASTPTNDAASAPADNAGGLDSPAMSTTHSGPVLVLDGLFLTPSDPDSISVSGDEGLTSSGAGPSSPLNLPPPYIPRSPMRATQATPTKQYETPTRIQLGRAAYHYSAMPQPPSPAAAGPAAIPAANVPAPVPASTIPATAPGSPTASVPAPPVTPRHRPTHRTPEASATRLELIMQALDEKFGLPKWLVARNQEQHQAGGNGGQTAPSSTPLPDPPICLFVHTSRSSSEPDIFKHYVLVTTQTDKVFILSCLRTLEPSASNNNSSTSNDSSLASQQPSADVRGGQNRRTHEEFEDTAGSAHGPPPICHRMTYGPPPPRDPRALSLVLYPDGIVAFGPPPPIPYHTKPPPPSQEVSLARTQIRRRPQAQQRQLQPPQSQPPQPQQVCAKVLTESDPEYEHWPSFPQAPSANAPVSSNDHSMSSSDQAIPPSLDARSTTSTSASTPASALTAASPSTAASASTTMAALTSAMATSASYDFFDTPGLLLSTLYPSYANMDGSDFTQPTASTSSLRQNSIASTSSAPLSGVHNHQQSALSYEHTTTLNLSDPATFDMLVQALVEATKELDTQKNDKGKGVAR
ncbi:hypothetical protein NLJ89_g9988 [Agrocybe chaxingu]|uniref:Uncharacterized protein n=1 Tax=Agrocybe chaxingu TaxID=84603 RepID=A0A9W8JZ00_9AGAR|nr:hypothetical protein NLJ89_g9988 [Agrocybe chaxingu]